MIDDEFQPSTRVLRVAGHQIEGLFSIPRWGFFALLSAAGSFVFWWLPLQDPYACVHDYLTSNLFFYLKARNGHESLFSDQLYVTNMYKQNGIVPTILKQAWLFSCSPAQPGNLLLHPSLLDSSLSYSIL